MGFGFVNFESNEAALSAMNAMNGTHLPQGKIMKISLARPAWKANIHSNVYISGLPLDYSEDDILRLFANYREQIENIRKLRDSRGIFRGIAVIRFDNEELAHDAMKRLNGVVLSEGLSPIQVRPWRPEFRPERIDPSFVSPVGSACSVTKSRSSYTLSPTPGGTSSLSGLTTPSPTSCHKLSFEPALPHPTDGWQEIWSKYVETQMKQIAMQYIPPTPSAPSTQSAPSLFVFHLPSDTTESTLRTLFEPYGPLASVRVLAGKGYGFVNFESVQSAVAAVNAMNGFRIGNKHLKVEFKKPTCTSPPPPTVVTDSTH
jgi:RNA recognition motif-containing protein